MRAIVAGTTLEDNLKYDFIMIKLQEAIQVMDTLAYIKERVLEQSEN